MKLCPLIQLPEVGGLGQHAEGFWQLGQWNRDEQEFIVNVLTRRIIKKYNEINH